MKSTKTKKVEIYLNGSIGIQVDDTFPEVMARIEDSVIPPDEFLYFNYNDGCRMAIRKSEIAGAAEYYDDAT
jgi:hypothetical protein